MGTIASIALRPSCTGWSTDCREITPGATFSIGEVWEALRGPLPSMGLPRASTTRPSSSLPTGTSRIRPVQRAVWPSDSAPYSPRITAPTESRSRFSAIPYRPPSNSSISPYWASASPWIRTIPSETPTMVPSFCASLRTSRFSILFLMMSLISLGFSCCMVSALVVYGANAVRFPQAFSIFRSGCRR